MGGVLGIAVAGLALFFVSAGSGDESGEAEAEIEAVVVKALTSTDPAICDEVFSEHWLDKHFASDSQEPVERCREMTAESSEAKATGVVRSISLDGTEAEVVAEARGDELSGTLEMSLVERAGWRLDELTGIRIDPKRYFKAEREEIRATPESVPPEAIAMSTCAVDYAAREVSAAELERWLLAGTQEFYVDSYESCSEEFEAFFFSPVVIGGKTGYSTRQAQCIGKTVKSMVDRDDRRRLFIAFAKGDPSPSDFAEKRSIATSACT